MITFGKNIQKRRINLGLDTNDLAKLANYPNRSYIEKIESDKMYPSTKKIPDLAKHYHGKLKIYSKMLKLKILRMILFLLKICWNL